MFEVTNGDNGVATAGRWKRASPLLSLAFTVAYFIALLPPPCWQQMIRWYLSCQTPRKYLCCKVFSVTDFNALLWPVTNKLLYSWFSTGQKHCQRNYHQSLLSTVLRAELPVSSFAKVHIPPLSSILSPPLQNRAVIGVSVINLLVMWDLCNVFFYQSVTHILCLRFSLFCISVLCPVSVSPEYLWAHTATFPPAPEKTRSAKVGIKIKIGGETAMKVEAVKNHLLRWYFLCCDWCASVREGESCEAVQKASPKVTFPLAVTHLSQFSTLTILHVVCWW